jgi:hypothetical protein
MDNVLAIKITYLNSENIPVNEPNEQQKQTTLWLNKASTTAATVSITHDGLLIWHDGIWESGTWENGTWLDGLWKNGTWHDGTWEKGTWKNGAWLDGIWGRGKWLDGIWLNGTWKNGLWLNGIWNNGTWQGGTWQGGTWQGGDWKCDIYERIPYMLSILNIIPDSNGYFTAYRVTNSDCSGKYNESFIQKPGRFSIDVSETENDSLTCVPGLHCSNMFIAHTYFGPKTTDKLWQVIFRLEDIAGFDGKKIRLKSGFCQETSFHFFKKPLVKDENKLQVS